MVLRNNYSLSPLPSKWSLLVVVVVVFNNDSLENSNQHSNLTSFGEVLRIFKKQGCFIKANPMEKFLCHYLSKHPICCFSFRSFITSREAQKKPRTLILFPQQGFGCVCTKLKCIELDV